MAKHAESATALERATSLSPLPQPTIYRVNLGSMSDDIRSTYIVDLWQERHGTGPQWRWPVAYLAPSPGRRRATS